MTATDFMVDIVTDGRGGSIVYREGDNRIDFSWEFAMPPSVALIFGPSARAWDRNMPWAAGRCAAIYNIVGAEVVRQKVEGGHYRLEIELDTNIGIIDVYRR
jgi:hypothetical protein